MRKTINLVYLFGVVSLLGCANSGIINQRFDVAVQSAHDSAASEIVLESEPFEHEEFFSESSVAKWVKENLGLNWDEVHSWSQADLNLYSEAIARAFLQRLQERYFRSDTTSAMNQCRTKPDGCPNGLELELAYREAHNRGVQTALASRLDSLADQRSEALISDKRKISSFWEAVGRGLSSMGDAYGSNRGASISSDHLVAEPDPVRSVSSDGETIYYNKIGNTLYGSDGSSHTKIGNTVFSSNGVSYSTIGSTTFGSDGTSATRIGGTIFRSDGKICRRLGSQLVCN